MPEALGRRYLSGQLAAVLSAKDDVGPDRLDHGPDERHQRAGNQQVDEVGEAIGNDRKRQAQLLRHKHEDKQRPDQAQHQLEGDAPPRADPAASDTPAPQRNDRPDNAAGL